MYRLRFSMNVLRDSEMCTTRILRMFREILVSEKRDFPPFQPVLLWYKIFAVPASRARGKSQSLRFNERGSTFGYTVAYAIKNKRISVSSVTSWQEHATLCHEVWYFNLRYDPTRLWSRRRLEFGEIPRGDKLRDINFPLLTGAAKSVTPSVNVSPCTWMHAKSTRFIPSFRARIWVP